MGKSERYQQRVMDQINGHVITPRPSGRSKGRFVNNKERLAAKAKEKERKREIRREQIEAIKVLTDNPNFGVF